MPLYDCISVYLSLPVFLVNAERRQPSAATCAAGNSSRRFSSTLSMFASHFRLVRLADVERDETTARCCCRRLECTFKHSPSRAYGYAQNTRVSNKVADFLHPPLYYKREI